MTKSNKTTTTTTTIASIRTRTTTFNEYDRTKGKKHRNKKTKQQERTFLGTFWISPASCATTNTTLHRTNFITRWTSIETFIAIKMIDTWSIYNLSIAQCRLLTIYEEKKERKKRKATNQKKHEKKKVKRENKNNKKIEYSLQCNAIQYNTTN